MGFVLEAFQKLSIEASNLVDLKREQEKAVKLLSPTGYGKRSICQLFAAAVIIKKVYQGQHSNTERIVICLQTSMISDQVKEGKSLSLDCAAIKDVKDLSSIASGKTQWLFA